MAKNEIRLQYSGFVMFAAKLLSIGTGLVFQLMIARATTASQYGIWFNISDILAYFTLLAGVLPFWTMRFVAREKEGAAKTGILTNLMLSAITVLIYLPLIPFITSSLGIPAEYTILYFLTALQILEIYSITALEGCLKARIPHTLGYGLLVAESCKVVLGYILIIQYQQPLLGAMFGLIVAFTVQIAYYIKLLTKQLKQTVKWAYVKEWLKGSVANIYHVIGNQMINFAFIMLFAYGGSDARGYFGAANQIAKIVVYSTFLAFALYPKLLAERKSEDITTSLKMVLMFALPMTAGAIILRDSYLIILQEVYAVAAPVLIVLAIDSLILTMSTTFLFVLFGLERIDEKATISFKELTKSRLFLAFSLPYIHSALTLPTTYYFLTTQVQNDPLTAALYVSIINTSARLAMFLTLFAIVRKMVPIHIPWKNIAKYAFASTIMAVFLFVVPHPTKISSTLSITAIAGIIYLMLLIAIDKEARMLTKATWQEIKSKIK